MKKLLNNPIFVGLLVALALGITFWPQLTERFTSRPRPQAINTDEQSTLELESDATTLSSPRRIRQVLSDYALPEMVRELFIYRETKPDLPVAAPEEAPRQVTSVHLTAIWRQPGVNLAVLNGRITTVGELLGEIEVVEINGEGVWLRLHDERTFLTLGQQHAFEIPNE
jgi:hypothetical protein